MLDQLQIIKTDRITKLYKRLYISREDFAFAAQFGSYILKKGWHFYPWEKRGTICLQQSAFTSSLIVFYSRPFTRSKGLPDFPLELLKYNNSEKKLHNKMIKLRHTVYAHSDDISYIVKPTLIDGNDISLFHPPLF